MHGCMGLDEPLPVTNVGMGYCVDQLEYDKPALTERYREFLGRGGWGLKWLLFFKALPFATISFLTLTVGIPWMITKKTKNGHESNAR